MGHDRVDAHVDDQLGALLVEMGVEAGKATDLMGHQHLRRAVDGQGTEPRGRANREEQGLGHPVPGRVHADAAAEEHADRPRPVGVDDGAQPRGEVIEAGVPRRGLEAVAAPHQRTFQTIGVMVQLRECTPFGAGVAA